MSIEVNTTRAEIALEGDTIVGLLRTPGSGPPWPALVFLGPLTSVKEQVPGNYAQALARRGFATLAIDNRHFGESTGQPRQYEHPSRKVQDVRAALTWLGAHSSIDGKRLGAVGICAGAGYMADAVATDDRIRAFGAVAGFFHDVDKQREWMGDGFESAIARARAARETFERSGYSEVMTAVGEGDVAMPLAEAFE